MLLVVHTLSLLLLPPVTIVQNLLTNRTCTPVCLRRIWNRQGLSGSKGSSGSIRRVLSLNTPKVRRLFQTEINLGYIYNKSPHRVRITSLRSKGGDGWVREPFVYFLLQRLYTIVCTCYGDFKGGCGVVKFASFFAAGLWSPVTSQRRHLGWSDFRYTHKSIEYVFTVYMFT